MTSKLSGWHAKVTAENAHLARYCMCTNTISFSKETDELCWACGTWTGEYNNVRDDLS